MSGEATDTTIENMAALAYAALCSARMVCTLRQLGWDDARIERIPNGYYLFVGDAAVAGGFSPHPAVAMEELQERAASIFFLDVPEA